MSGNQGHAGVNSARRRFLHLAGGALVTSGLATCASTPVPRPARAWRAVQALLEERMAERRYAGLLAALSYDGEPLAYRAEGTLAFDSRVPVDENSLWRIYSMTKPVTGFAALLLIEDGRLELDQPVADVLPAFSSMRVALNVDQGLESRPAATVMTMRHLLTHTSGIVYWFAPADKAPLPAAYRQRGITPGVYGDMLDGLYYGPQARGLDEMIARLAELPLAFDPGTGWDYSLGLDVMGAVIERITGHGLDVFMRERIFDPLDMRSTGFQVARKDAARLTTNYASTREGLRPIDAGATSAWLDPPVLIAGGAGLVSSARDFARFGEMLLDEGAVGNIRVADPQTVRLALSNLLPAGVAYDGGYGAGALRALPGSQPFFAWPGIFGWVGAATTMWWIEPARRGQVVFMAQHLPPVESLWSDVAAAVAADLQE
jgi:CubicO group peptidase (beta-lactamase class C family)